MVAANDEAIFRLHKMAYAFKLRCHTEVLTSLFQKSYQGTKILLKIFFKKQLFEWV